MMLKNTESKIDDPRSLRVLMVEDSEDDELLIIRELKKGGYDPEYERVETAAAMKKALKDKKWDVILCDYKLPQFNAPSAIAVLKEINIDIPIIVVSGAIGEETAADCMRLGAHDYIMKGNLSRLCPAIKRELEESESRIKRKEAEEALRESEEKYRNLFENANETIFVAQDGKVVFFNPMALMLLGYEGAEFASRPFIDFIHPDDRGMIIDRHFRRLKGEDITRRYSFRIIHKDGGVKWVDLDTVLIDWKGKPATLNFMNDITERRQAEEEREQNFERVRKALLATVHAISRTVEIKDPYTSGHQQRVADLSRAMAAEMGLSAERQDFIHTASIIHDIGKIALPAEILSKPTKLTELEFSLIKTHARIGFDILKDIEFPWPVADVVFQHHERMNGSGYPQGIKGKNILQEARILAVADVVEAITFHRPYRPALGIDFALEEIYGNKGILYDAAAADACLRLFKEKDYTWLGSA